MRYATLYRLAWEVVQIATGGRERPLLRELMQTERAPAAALREVQWARLRALLAHAEATVPFYTDRFREAGLTAASIRDFEDFARLPRLTKADIRRAGARLRSSRPGPCPSLDATGGSTGVPLTFHVDRAQREYAKAAILRARRVYGFERGDKVAYVWGADRDLPSWGWSSRMAVALKRQRWLDAFRLNGERLARFVAEMRAWRPDFVVGYASALHAVARTLLEIGERGIRPRAIESTAEKLWPAQRRDIESAFGCQVFDVYGSREMGLVAAECEAHAGLHVPIEIRYVEVVDDAGRPVGPGGTGRVLVTDLTNRSMPFLRYENGDLATVAAGTCTCGRRHPLLAAIDGRTSDLIRLGNGAVIHGEYFTHLFYGASGIEQFQVRQEAPDRIRILARLGGASGRATLEGIRDRLATELAGIAAVEAEVVQEIPETATGKRRFTVSLIDRSGAGS